MRRILLIIMVFGLFSCGTQKRESDRPFVAVSIAPQKYLVSTILDTLADVHVIIPPGASPATWEPSTSDMKDLGDALLYFRVGHIGFEQAWISDIMDVNPELSVYDLSQNIPLRGIHYSHGDHRHSGVDPHIWMSPENMEIMARNVFREVQELFPNQKPQLRRNYSKLMVEIKECHQYAQKELAGYEGRSFLIFHPSLGYLADAYGLEQLSIEFEGKEPGPSYLKELIDSTRALKINTIFVQQEFDRSNAELIAREIKGNIVQFDPLSEKWAEEFKSTIRKLKSSFE